MTVIMQLCAYICLLFIFSSIAMVTAAPVIIGSEVTAMMYLQRFGYMNETSQNSASLISQEAVTNAIRDFQRFAGLNETGSLDNNTIAMMNMPRCGVRDKVGHGGSARKKRYALQGSKWRVNDLTYKIGKYPSRIKDLIRVDKEVARAFKVWSDVTPLNFIQKKSGRVHIDVRFEEGEHGDGDPFDGPGRTLAHAFFPQFGGDAHFDDDEKWTIGAYYGTNLFQVAAHEFGHSLGLSHSDVRSALMAPFYRGYDPSFRLDEDDMHAIQGLYGKRQQRPKPSQASPPERPWPTPDISGSADLCQDASIDAVTRTEDGHTYVFKGDYYWEILQTGIAVGYPRKISEDFGGLPGNLDAALTWSDGKTFFFKGSNYWRFRNKLRDPGYPKQIIVGFEGIPNNIDAAFVWNGNGKTYFFKDDQYWRFDSRSDPPVSARYPRPISNWDGLPNNIDAAFQWENGRMYFFKGRNYYRFNDRTFAVDTSRPPYPRSTSVWWFDCRAMAGRVPQKSGLQGRDQAPVLVEGNGIVPTPANDAEENGVDDKDLDVSILQQNGDESTSDPRYPRGAENSDVRLHPMFFTIVLFIVLQLMM